MTHIPDFQREGEMPPRAYTLLHPEAKLSAAEQLLIDEFQRAGLRPCSRPADRRSHPR